MTTPNMTTPPMPGPLAQLSLLRDCRSRRVSSWDREGGNRDWVSIAPGKTAVLADIRGAGRITHIWMTVGAYKNPDRYLRTLVLRAWWDNEKQPSIEVPLGDFFNVGHAKVASFSCLPFNMSANPGRNFAGMNCYLPMPFAKRAKITLHNEDDVEIPSCYYYIDYEEHAAVGPEEGRLHVQWRRANPCDGNPDGRQEKIPNLSDAGNYTICEAVGRGHFVGCNLSVHNLHGGWWGEGDDMFVIDGEGWPPSLHGTGSEDYFGHAWGMQDNHSLYNGTSFHEPGGHAALGEKITVYRFHVADPVVFHRSLRVSIEHGHANQRSDDYASTAYWYQSEPHAPFPALPPAAERLPRALSPAAPRTPVAAPCTRYLVIGPFDNPVKRKQRTGLDTVYPPEREFDLRAEYAGKQGRPCRWQAVETPPSGVLNLLNLYRENFAVAYALTYIHATKARKARLLIGSDDGVKVWLNDELVHRVLEERGCRADQDELVVSLRKGWNTLLCKVEQARMGWELVLRVAELDGELSYALSPDEVYRP